MTRPVVKLSPKQMSVVMERAMERTKAPSPKPMGMGQGPMGMLGGLGAMMGGMGMGAPPGAGPMPGPSGGGAGPMPVPGPGPGPGAGPMPMPMPMPMPGAGGGPTGPMPTEEPSPDQGPDPIQKYILEAENVWNNVVSDKKSMVGKFWEALFKSKSGQAFGSPEDFFVTMYVKSKIAPEEVAQESPEAMKVMEAISRAIMSKNDFLVEPSIPKQSPSGAINIGPDGRIM